MTRLKQLRSDIFFLQEIPSSEVNRVKQSWIGRIFPSKFPLRARGAAIKLLKSTEQPNFRFVITSLFLQFMTTT